METGKSLLVTEKNYKFCDLSITGISKLFDRFDAPKIVSRESYIAADIFGNRAKIDKTVSKAGYLFHVENLDYIAPATKPGDVVKWDDSIYCECGQEIEKVTNEDKIQNILESQEITQYCSGCDAEITIKLKVRPTKNDVTWKQLLELWSDFLLDIFPAIECEVWIDEVV